MDQKTLETIQKVCKKISKRFKFSIYDEDDIYQECFIICLKLLEKWDGERPLENFLNNSASNKIRSLILAKAGSNSEYLKERRNKIENSMNINNVPDMEIPHYQLDEDEMDNRIIFELIESDLPIHLRKDYLKMKTGQYLPPHKKENLIESIREIYVESLLDKAFTDNIDKYEVYYTIPFKSGILGFTDEGLIVEYAEKEGPLD